MKTKFYLSGVFSLIVLLCSCSNGNASEDRDTTTQETLRHVRVETITDADGQTRTVTVPDGPLEDLINNYITFDDGQYHITISKSEAIELGVDAAEYDEVVKSVEEGNKMLAETIEEYSNRDDIKSLVINGQSVDI